jgi:low temperature requirement protein LtrA
VDLIVGLSPASTVAETTGSVGASGVDLGAEVLVAVVVGIALAALWRAYFDLVILSAQRRLSASRGEERARLALDSYSYLHLPTVAGIISVILGVLALLLCGLPFFETATSREFRRERRAR